MEDEVEEEVEEGQDQDVEQELETIVVNTDELELFGGQVGMGTVHQVGHDQEEYTTSTTVLVLSDQDGAGAGAGRPAAAGPPAGRR